MSHRSGRKEQRRRCLRDYYRSLDILYCPYSPRLLAQHVVYRNKEIPGERERFRDYCKSFAEMQKILSEDKFLAQNVVYKNNIFMQNLSFTTEHSTQDSASADKLLIEESSCADKVPVQNFVAGLKRVREVSFSEFETLPKRHVLEAWRCTEHAISDENLPINCIPPIFTQISQVGPEDSSKCDHMPKDNTMTSFGRGRGWACNSSSESILRRPGKPIQQHSTEVSDLINAIDALALNNSVPQEKVDEIVTLLQNALVKESLRSIVEQLYKVTLEDRLFGIKLAIPLSDSKFVLLRDEQNDEPLRSNLLSVMQDEFEKSEEVGEANAMHFRNAASFFGEVYYRMRIAVRPLRCLMEPFLTYLNMLLETATLEDIEIVAVQVVINGITLNNTALPELPAFFNKIREVLISRNVCSISRGLLLLTLEVIKQNYSPLPEDLQEFYTTQLGSRTLINMQRYSIQDSSNTNNNNANMTCDKQEIDTVPPKARGKVRNRVQNPTTNAVPRAIRGSGAGDVRKDRKDGLKSEPAFNAEPQTRPRPVKFANPKHEHDDRFEKDYD